MSDGYQPDLPLDKTIVPPGKSEYTLEDVENLIDKWSKITETDYAIQSPLAFEVSRVNRFLMYKELKIKKLEEACIRKNEWIDALEEEVDKLRDSQKDLILDNGRLRGRIDFFKELCIRLAKIAAINSISSDQYASYNGSAPIIDDDEVNKLYKELIIDLEETIKDETGFLP